VAPVRINRRLYVAAALTALVLLVAGVWFYLRRQAPPRRGFDSVAVLPLQSLREDETDKTIALGLTDTLVTRLGSLRSVAVRPIVSVGRYAKGEQDRLRSGGSCRLMRSFAGTLQHTEGHLRINARLLRVSDNTPHLVRQF